MPPRGARVRITKSLTRLMGPLAVKADPPSTIFILSDVRLYREALAWNLLRDGSLNVLGEASPSASTLACLISLSPDVIILDMAIPDALAVARSLREEIPRTKIVAFAVSDVDA